MTSTAAKLTSKPPKSSGLTPPLNDALFNARAAGRPVDDLVVIGLLSPVGHGEENGNKSVKLEWTRLEVIRAGSDASGVRDLITRAWEQRHSLIPLPLDFATRTDDDQRRFLLGAIDERAKEIDSTDTEVGAAWREYWGIDPSLKDKDSPAGYARPDWKKAAAHHLREFALSWGALADETSGGDDEDDDEGEPKTGKDAAAGPDA